MKPIHHHRLLNLLTNLLTTLSLLTFLNGCGSLQNSHETVEEVIDGGVVVEKKTTTDKNGGRALLMKATLEKMKSSTTDKDYKHSLSASGVEASGDADMVKALGAAFKDVFEAGVNAGAKAIVPIP